VSSNTRFFRIKVSIQLGIQVLSQVTYKFWNPSFDLRDQRNVIEAYDSAFTIFKVSFLRILTKY
jgi:hypothetical protein